MINSFISLHGCAISRRGEMGLTLNDVSGCVLLCKGVYVKIFFDKYDREYNSVELEELVLVIDLRSLMLLTMLLRILSSGFISEEGITDWVTSTPSIFAISLPDKGFLITPT